MNNNNPTQKVQKKTLIALLIICIVVLLLIIVRQQIVNDELLKYSSVEAIAPKEQSVEDITAEGIIKKYNLELVKCQTGFRNSYGNSFFPTILMKWRNNSSDLISDYIKIRYVFYSDKEEIDSDYKYLCAGSEPFEAGLNRLLNISSDRGWTIYGSPSSLPIVICKLYIEDAFWKEISIDKKFLLSDDVDSELNDIL